MKAEQKSEIERLATVVLDTRKSFPGATLDVLYDQDSMPPALRRAHADLDKAVDRLYRGRGFKFERERVEHLFEIYESNLAPLDATIRRAGLKKAR